VIVLTDWQARHLRTTADLAIKAGIHHVVARVVESPDGSALVCLTGTHHRRHVEGVVPTTTARLDLALGTLRAMVEAELRRPR
jgi:hypothetical protein